VVHVYHRRPRRWDSALQRVVAKPSVIFLKLRLRVAERSEGMRETVTELQQQPVLANSCGCLAAGLGTVCTYAHIAIAVHPATA
jgi:hypothetical protein